MVNTNIRLILSFAAEYGEALYSQQKQDRELSVTHHELLIAKNMGRELKFYSIPKIKNKSPWLYFAACLLFQLEIYSNSECLSG